MCCARAALPVISATDMDKDTNEQIMRPVEVLPDAPAEVTIEETMLQRDPQLRSAMQTLTAAISKATDTAAHLVQLNNPVEALRLQDFLRAAESRGDLDATTLAGEIQVLALRLLRLESALARAIRRARRGAA
jgi:hypothetical protein